jgi:hypothetical protein
VPDRPCFLNNNIIKDNARILKSTYPKQRAAVFWTSTTFDYFDNDGGIFEKAYWQNPTHIWTTKELNDFCYQKGPSCACDNPKIHTPFCAQKPGQGWSYYQLSL